MRCDKAWMPLYAVTDRAWLRGRTLIEQAEEALHAAVADTCYQVLCDSGVYKQDEAGQIGLKKFLDTLF